MIRGECTGLLTSLHTRPQTNDGTVIGSPPQPSQMSGQITNIYVAAHLDPFYDGITISVLT